LGSSGGPLLRGLWRLVCLVYINIGEFISRGRLSEGLLGTEQLSESLISGTEEQIVERPELVWVPATQGGYGRLQEGHVRRCSALECRGVNDLPTADLVPLRQHEASTANAVFPAEAACQASRTV